MKKVLSMMALSAFIFAGCQEDLETQLEGSGEESVVRITLQAPEAMGVTRADAGAGYVNSAKGGITNVDWTKYDLRYQVAVYDADGSVQVISPKTVIVKDASAIQASFDVQLVNNRTYKFVAWADFVDEGSTADKHYDTSDLTNIVCLDKEDAQLNDETRDAYFVTTNEKVSATTGVSLTLRRPFAKVRLVTTDWNPKDPDRRPNEIRITYYGCQRFTGLNAVTGVATGGSKLPDWTTATTYTATIDPDEKDYSGGYDGGEDNGPAEGAVGAGGEEENTPSTTSDEEPSVKDYENRTLMVDYLIASPEQTTIKFRYQAFQENKKVSAYLFKTKIPIQRNFLTTLLGNMLTEGINVSMTCEEGFEEEFNKFDTNGEIKALEPVYDENTHTYTLSKPEHLVWLSQQTQDAADVEKPGDTMKKNFPEVKGGYTFVLANDIDMKGVKWTPIHWEPTNNDGKSAGTFDGDGHVIRNLSVDGTGMGQEGLFGYAVIDIKDLTIENATINKVASGFAGAIVGNLYGDIENCHVKHVFIRASDYYTVNHPETESTGGMVGLHSDGNMTNCSADDVNVKGHNSVGGLTGRVVNNWSKDASKERSYKDCSVSNATMWATATDVANEDNYNYVDTPFETHLGSVIGTIYDLTTDTGKSDGTPTPGKIKFEGTISVSNCEYKVGLYDTANGKPVIFTGVSADTEIGPQYEYFGNVGNDAIAWDEDSKTVGPATPFSE